MAGRRPTSGWLAMCASEFGEQGVRGLRGPRLFGDGDAQAGGAALLHCGSRGRRRMQRAEAGADADGNGEESMEIDGNFRKALGELGHESDAIDLIISAAIASGKKRCT